MEYSIYKSDKSTLVASAARFGYRDTNREKIVAPRNGCSKPTGMVAA